MLRSANSSQFFCFSMKKTSRIFRLELKWYKTLRPCSRSHQTSLTTEVYFFVMRYDIFFFEGDRNVTVRKRGWSAITVGKRVQKYNKNK